MNEAELRKINKLYDFQRGKKRVTRLDSTPPASATANGKIGTITWDSSYIYLCVDDNTWKRVAINTW